MGKAGLEFARDGKDQTGLDRRIQRAEKVRKCQAGYRVRKWRHWSLHSVARKIDPFQEVSDLVATDAQSDRKHFGILNFLAHGCVQTRPALLDVSEMKACHIRN